MIGTERRAGPVASEAVPMVSIVVPCRNERARIRGCLESLLASDYPGSCVELLVVDGMSDDGTRDVIAECARRHPAIRMLDNARRTTPAALNIGVAAARGSVLMLAGAHAEFPRAYVRDLVASLREAGADGVGGVCETAPGASTPLARAIAVALGHPFGVGNSWFRIGTSGPRWVDTVPFGCYPIELFRRVGGFDEELVRNQDDEFNCRVLRHGGRLLLVPHVVSRYYARTRLRDVARMFHQYGRFKPLVMRKVGTVPSLRQLAPGAFVATLGALLVAWPWVDGSGRILAGVASLYTGAALVAAARALRRHGIRCALALLVVFPTIHLAYGAGFLTGLVRLSGRGAGGRVSSDALPLSR